MPTKKKKEQKYRYAITKVPVLGRKDEFCGKDCVFMRGAFVPFCHLDPSKPPEILDVVPRRGPIRTKNCVESGRFVDVSRDRALISKLVGGI